MSLTLSVLSLAVTGALLAALPVPAVIGAAVTLCTVACCVVLVAGEVVSKVAR